MTGEPYATRWGAWSHQRIYTATHAVGTERAHPLATTVTLWWEAVADLGEIRARYEAAVNRLNEANAGASTDAAGARSQLVTRGLTEAQERAGLAGARRARLHELNEHLRQKMPEPDGSVENRSAFLDQGLGWLTPPEFHRAENERRNAEERARDLMRAYEKGISPEALTVNAHNSADIAAHSGQTGNEPTIPLSTTQFAEVPPADQAQTTAPPAEQDPDQPAADGFKRITGQLGLITRYPPYWAYAEFGPQGHDHLDSDTDGSDDQSGRAAGGPMPAARDDGDHYPIMSSRVSDNLFDPDIDVIDGAIGQ